jgi:hypothetical protein
MEDIPALADHFIEKYSLIHGKKVKGISREALDHLIQHIEDNGIIAVFNGIVENNTSRPINVEECRGFVLVDSIAPFMFVNNADGKAAQMFTIVHELAHIFYGYCGFTNLDIFREGVATYLASPENRLIVELNTVNLCTNGTVAYHQGANLIHTILISFSKAELFSFLKEAANSSDMSGLFKNRFFNSI